MFIKYNGTNIHALGTPDGKEVFWFRPGWNEFPNRIWEMYVNDEEIKKMLADKKLELMNITVEVPGKSKKKTTKELGMDDEPINLKEIQEKDAVQIVKSTFNRDILQRWLDEETRHKVKRSLDEQIKPLTTEASS